MTRADCERLAESADDAPAAATNTQDTTPSPSATSLSIYVHRKERNIFIPFCVQSIDGWRKRRKELGGIVDFD